MKKSLMRIYSKLLPNGWFPTVRAKIAVAISLLLGLISLFMFTFFPARLEKQAVKAISDKAQSIAEMTAFSIGPALYFEDTENIDEVIKSARQNEDLAYIVVLDGSGGVIAAFNKNAADGADFAQVQDVDHISADGTIYRVMTPVMLPSNGRNIGQLYLGLSLRNLKAEVANSRATIALVSLVVLVIGMIAVFIISIVVTGHLSIMVETVEQISRGDLTQRAAVSSKDEVGHLARAFNLMVDNLESTQNELESLNQNLEEQVRERTRDLQERGEQLRGILESTTDGILVVDSLGQIIHSNKRFVEMWRIPEELIGEGSDEQLIGYVLEQLSDPDGFLSKVQSLYETSEVSFDILYFKDDRVFERFSSPLIIETGIASRVWSFRDVTERIKAEKEKAELENRLRRAEKMEALGTLAGGVAHDLNNILSAIVGYPDLLLMSLPEDSDLRNPISIIQKSGEKAAAVVQDLLTLARRGVAVTEICNLNEIILDYLGSPVHKEIQAYHPNVKFEINTEETLLNILGSPVHLSKTIMNLVSNAAEAMPDGGNVTISTRNQYVDRPIKGYDNVEKGDYVVLRVSDNGIGISQEDLGRIFEPFYTKKIMGRSGTGLGMAVVWGTIKDHDGYINVDSTEGEGTTFELYFPVTREELVEGKPSLSIEQLMGDGEMILVIDDVPEQRELAKGMLELLGYSVKTVPGGEDAVEYLRDNSVDLLVLDMIMDPGIDGLGTYRRIVELHPGQKAVISSGFSETDRVKEAQALGAGQYIKKPFVIHTLGVAVKAELAISARQLS